jgi:hypothetical protein
MMTSTRGRLPQAPLHLQLVRVVQPRVGGHALEACCEGVLCGGVLVASPWMGWGAGQRGGEVFSVAGG